MRGSHTRHDEIGVASKLFCDWPLKFATMNPIGCSEFVFQICRVCPSQRRKFPMIACVVPNSDAKSWGQGFCHRICKYFSITFFSIVTIGICSINCTWPWYIKLSGYVITDNISHQNKGHVIFVMKTRAQAVMLPWYGEFALLINEFSTSQRWDYNSPIWIHYIGDVVMFDLFLCCIISYVGL